MSDASAAGGQRKPSSGPSKVFLPVCPVCVRGKVVKDVTDEQADSYVCTNCGSKLSETIFGFVYLTIDETYVTNPDAIKNRTFTKPQLAELSAKAAKSGESSLASIKPKEAPAKPPPKPAPKPSPPPPPAPVQTKADADAAQEGRELVAELAQGAPAADEELWWEIDEEELARRQASTPEPSPPAKQPRQPGEVTIDDLLEDLGK